MNREAERKRLVELIDNYPCMSTAEDCFMESISDDLASYLIDNGTVVPPDELYSIVDKGTIYATVSKAMVDWLPLYVVKEPEKYGYYRTREEAQKALEGSGEK